MNERIARVRKHAGLTQEEFGARIGNLSRNYIWMIEKGDRTPSDRTISDICREFNIDEDWLRTGKGDMLLQRSRDEELSAFFGDLLSGTPDFKRRLISVLSRLDETEWELLEKMAQKLVLEMQKKRPTLKESAYEAGRYFDKWSTNWYTLFSLLSSSMESIFVIDDISFSLGVILAPASLQVTFRVSLLFVILVHSFYFCKHNFAGS